MTSLTKQEANALLAQKLQQASTLISECETLADEHSLSFSSPIGEYGMGGTYTGRGPEPEKDENGEYIDSDWESSDSYGWNASSQSC